MKNSSSFLVLLLVCSGCATAPHFEPLSDAGPQADPSVKYAVLLKQRLKVTVDASRLEYRPGPHEKEIAKYRLASARPSVVNPAIHCPGDASSREVRFAIKSLAIGVESVPDQSQVYVLVEKSDDKPAPQGGVGLTTNPTAQHGPIVLAMTLPDWGLHPDIKNPRREANLVRWSAQQGPEDVKLGNTLGSLQSVQQARLQLATERGNAGALVADEVILRTKFGELDKQEGDLVELFVGTVSETKAASASFVVEPTSNSRSEEKIKLGAFSPCTGVIVGSEANGPRSELSLLVTPDGVSQETLEKLEKREAALPRKERSGPPVRIPLETTVTILLGDAKLASGRVEFSQKGLLVRAVDSSAAVSANKAAAEDVPMGGLVWITEGNIEKFEQRREGPSVLKAP